MPLLQVQIDAKLKKAIKTKSSAYGVPASSLVKIVLTKAFIEKKETIKEGNVFNAQRDNNGQGLKIDDLIDML
jgi:hypothetical protein